MNTGIENKKLKFAQIVSGKGEWYSTLIGHVFTILDESDDYYFIRELESGNCSIHKCDVAIVGLTDSPFSSQEGEKEPIDAGREPTAEDVKRWFQLLVGIGEEAMQKDMAELYSKRIPDAGMEKIIRDAFDAGKNFEYSEHFGKVPNPFPNKERYLHNLIKPNKQ